MRYLIAILVTALSIGGALSALVYVVLGANPGYFFAKFVAAPVGLIGTLLGFLLYDSLWPRRSERPTDGDNQRGSDKR